MRKVETLLVIKKSNLGLQTMSIKEFIKKPQMHMFTHDGHKFKTVDALKNYVDDVVDTARYLRGFSVACDNACVRFESRWHVVYKIWERHPMFLKCVDVCA